MQFADFIDS